MSHQNPRLNPADAVPDEAIQRTRPILSRRRSRAAFARARAAARVALSPLRLRAVPGGSSFTGFGIFGQGLLDQGREVPPWRAIPGNDRGCGHPDGPGQENSTVEIAPIATRPAVWVSPVPILPWSVPMGARSKERLAAIMLAGVSGRSRSRAPPTARRSCRLGGAFTDEKLAAITTYLRATWGNTPARSIRDLPRPARSFGAHLTAPYSEADLLKCAPRPDPSDKKP